MNAPMMRRAGAGAVFLFLLSACSLIDRAKEIRRVQKDLIGDEVPVVISGEVTTSFPTTKPIVLILSRELQGRASVDAHWVLYRPGPFAFLKPPGTYRLFAFVDENEDLAPQVDEPSGWYGAPSDVRTSPGAPAEGLEIALRHRRDSLTSVRVSSVLATVDLRSRAKPRHAGDVVSLNDARFSSEAGKLGFWEPSRFLDRFGTGIYFLHPYDASKVPVLFVHGASGYPQEWTYLASVLDGTRFQPWVFHYPSGMRLWAVSDVLADTLAEIRSRFRVRAVVIVAHSMGGLVSRMAIRGPEQGAGDEFVRLFVTLSTPWLGHAGATRGVEHSPVVVPSWNDMAEGSAFLKALHASTLPAAAAYHLFFGYRGGETLTMRENSDGSVTLQSVLDRWAQEQAVGIHGFHEDHTSILRSGEVSRELNRLLARAAARIQDSAVPAATATH